MALPWQLKRIASVKRPGVLGDLANTLHLNEAEARMCPLVHAIFNVTFYDSPPTKQLELKPATFPDRGRTRGSHAKRQWSDCHWSDIVRGLRGRVVMNDAQGGDHHSITALLNPLYVIWKSGVHALP